MRVDVRPKVLLDHVFGLDPGDFPTIRYGLFPRQCADYDFDDRAFDVFDRVDRYTTLVNLRAKSAIRNRSRRWNFRQTLEKFLRVASTVLHSQAVAGRW